MCQIRFICVFSVIALAAMAVCGHLLLVLIPVLSICGATEYYVRPTEPTNTSCPGQPCLTLSQYVNDSDHYFKSNTEFKFLPGTHQMDRPVVIRDVQNVTMESYHDGSGEHPHVVLWFVCNEETGHRCFLNPMPITTWVACVRCAAVQFWDVCSVTIEGISVSVQPPSEGNAIGGIGFHNVSKLHMQAITASSSNSSSLKMFGIVVSEATSVQVHSVGANNFSVGFVLNHTTNTNLSDIIVMNNGEGMYLYGSTNTTIAAMYNEDGIRVNSSSNTSITDSIVLSNSDPGIEVSNSSIIHISNTTVMCTGTGLSLDMTNDTHVSNITVMNSNSAGIYLYNAVDTSITDSVIMYSEYGIYTKFSTNTKVSNVVLNYSVHFGIFFYNATNTSITDSVIMYSDIGIDVDFSTNTKISTAVVVYSSHAGIFNSNATDTSITDSVIMYSDYGIGVAFSTNIKISNAVVMYSSRGGIYLYSATNTNITDSVIVYCALVSQNYNSGIVLLASTNTNVSNMVLIYGSASVRLGKYMNVSVNYCISNVTVTINTYGVILSDTTDVRVTNTTVAGGIHLVNCQRTTFVYLSITKGLTIFQGTDTMVLNSSLSDINSATAITTDTASLPAVIVLYYSQNLHLSDCSFSRNTISAINAVASTITVSGNLVFSDNTATAGTAFILTNSSMTLEESSHVYCANNNAVNTGGVFYITTNEYYEVDRSHLSILPQTTCFFNVLGGISQTRFTFVNNSAGTGGDILYGGLVALGETGERNCLQVLKDISNISQSSLSLISSDPSRVCFCNGTGQPDCLTIVDPIPRKIYPGQTVHISAVVVGQDFGTVVGSAFAQFLQLPSTEDQPQIESVQYTQGVTQNSCSILSYTIFSQLREISDTVLLLTTENTKISHLLSKDEINEIIEQYKQHSNAATKAILGLPVYVNVSVHPCPPGFMLTTQPPFRCDCNQLLQEQSGVTCHIQDQTIGRSGLVWVGMIKDDRGIVAVSESCPYDYCSIGDSNMTLNNSDSQCMRNHSGILCGGCQPGLSLALGSAQCLSCSNKYLALLIPFALAGCMVLCGLSSM